MSTDRGTLRPYVTMRVVRAATTSTSALLTARTTRGTAARRPAAPAASGPVLWSGTRPSPKRPLARAAIDAAYRSKYDRYAASIISPQTRAATLKLMPPS